MGRNIEKMISFSPALARLFTYLLFFLMPLMFFKDWMSTFVSSKLPVFFVLSVLAFLFIATHLIFQSEYRPAGRQLLPMLPIVILVGSLGVSAFLAPLRDLAFRSTVDRGDGWFFFFHLALLIFTVFVLMLRDRTGAYKRNILLATLSSAGIVALTAWLGNEGFNVGGRTLALSQGGGFLGNSSLAATYLLFAAFLGLMVIFSRDMFNKGVRRFALAVTLLAALSPVLINFNLWRFAISFSSIFSTPQILLGSGRGVAFGVILGFIVALAARLVYARKKLWKIVGVGVIFASIAGYLFFFVSIQQADSPLQTIFKEQAGANRLIFWDIARKAIAERPILGWGLENFRVPFHRDFDPALLRTENSSEPWTDRAHNLFYDMAVAGGYLGLLLFITFIGSLIWGIYSAGKKKSLRPWGAAILFGLVYAYLFQGLFVFDTIFSYLMLGFLYAFVFGISKGENVSIPKVKISTEYMFYKILAESVLVAGALVSFIFITVPVARTASLYGRIMATPLLERTSFWSSILDNPEAQSGADLARLALYVETEYGKRRNEIFSPGNEAIRSDFAKDFQIIASVLEQNAESQRERNRGVVIYMTLNLAARIHNSSIMLSGTTDEKQLAQAEYYGRETIKESPMNPQGYWILAQTLVLQKKIKEADEMLEKAITIDPYNKQSHRLSIQLANGLNDKKLATFRTERAKQYIPGFALP